MKTKSLKELFEAIDDRSHELYRAKREFLQAAGWKETCSTPGAIWLWEKTLPDGRAVLVSESAAIHMEESLSSDEIYPDEGDDDA